MPRPFPRTGIGPRVHPPPSREFAVCLTTAVGVLDYAAGTNPATTPAREGLERTASGCCPERCPVARARSPSAREAGAFERNRTSGLVDVKEVKRRFREAGRAAAQSGPAQIVEISANSCYHLCRRKDFPAAQGRSRSGQARGKSLKEWRPLQESNLRQPA